MGSGMSKALGDTTNAGNTQEQGGGTSTALPAPAENGITQPTNGTHSASGIFHALNKETSKATIAGGIKPSGDSNSGVKSIDGKGGFKGGLHFIPSLDSKSLATVAQAQTEAEHSLTISDPKQAPTNQGGGAGGEASSPDDENADGEDHIAGDH